MEKNYVKSMTGYGKGVGHYGDKKISVEIKTLNSKQLDLSLRVPAVYREKEFEIRSKVNKGVVRGKTDIFISVESGACSRSCPINGEVFKDYYNQIAAISGDLNIEKENIIGSILCLPEVLQSQKEEISDSEWAVLLSAVEEAIASLDEFRSQEGQHLIDDLTCRIDKIERLKDAVVPFEKSRIDVVRTRIMDNLKSLENVTIDNNRFEQEMIFYLEKFDITEEKVRLKNHLDYFKQVSKEESAGRKLGFIAQEIGREVNTMGSKANNADIQKLVVEMKDELEKIKEQVLNIL